MVELHRDHGMGLCVHCYNYLKRKKFITLKEELGIPCTLNKPMSKYPSNPIHVTAARYSNKYHNANLTLGSKFKYIYILNGEYLDKIKNTSHVVAFEKKIPRKYIIDYKKMEDRLLQNKIETLFECLDWKLDDDQRSLDDF